MKAARVVVLTVAIAAGGVAALLAGRSGNPPEIKAEAPKFNTVDIKNASGVSVVSFGASELADAFSAASVRVPDIKEPTIWRDASKPLKARAEDLIRRRPWRRDCERPRGAGRRRRR
jgi:hypothetical protein